MNQKRSGGELPTSQRLDRGFFSLGCSGSTSIVLLPFFALIAGVEGGLSVVEAKVGKGGVGWRR